MVHLWDPTFRQSSINTAEIDKLKNLPKDFTRKHLDHTQDIKFMKEDGSDKIRPGTCNNAQ